MPTKRTIQQLYDLFEPGQPDASITPDRVQDLVLSLRPGFGRINLAAQAQTSIATQNVWVKVAGTTELGPGAFTFAMPQNNRLQCNCPISSLLVASGAVSIINGNNKTFEVALAKNGTILDDSIQTVRIGAGGDVEDVPLFTDFAQVQGDYIEIWIRNLTDTTNATITRLYLRAMTFVL